ncbi:hypothetical protein LCGC14_0592230 [marine sediment metagenome]|uniref:Uncharacterized protein n=1 Tax=marine sediment metagenome TaxID=412755 RepID=A0A0F9RD06_9ZZZZ
MVPHPLVAVAVAVVIPPMVAVEPGVLVLMAKSVSGSSRCHANRCETVDIQTTPFSAAYPGDRTLGF